MRTEIEAIVLTAVRFSDTASMVHLYSDLFGSLSARVSRPGGRRTAAGTRAFFAPLSIVLTTIDYRSGREVFVPSGTEPILMLTAPGRDPAANAQALFATELLHRLLREASPDRTLFQFLRESLRELDRLHSPRRASWHLKLMTGLTYHLGLLPRTDGYREGMILDAEEGSFRDLRRSEEAERRASSALLYRFLTEGDPLAIPLSHRERNDLMRLLLDYFACHFPEVGRMQSPAILTRLSEPTG